MLHARKDYDRFQDPLAEDEGGIPYDEPVFLLRAQDKAAPGAVDAWAAIAEQVGADAEIIAKARQHAKDMRGWQRTNTIQIPDL